MAPYPYICEDCNASATDVRESEDSDLHAHYCPECGKLVAVAGTIPLTAEAAEGP